jgi:hypothetical protein
MAAPAATKNNTPILIGAGITTLALAALAAYFILSKPQAASLQPDTAAATNIPAPAAPAPGTEPIAGVIPGQPVVTTGQAGMPGQPVVPGQAPVAGQPMAPAAQSGAPVGTSVIKYANATANIRDLATAEAPSRVVGSVKRGASLQGVMHVGLSGSTYWFKLADGRGYISAVNLVDAPPAAVVAAAPPPAAASGPLCSVVDRTGSNLRIRNAPNGGVLGGMPNGIQLRWLSEATDSNGALWYRVDPVQRGYPTGWVYADHVVC